MTPPTLHPDPEATSALLAEIRGCRICEEHLPLGPRPVVQFGATSRLLIIGQAPGKAVHASGVPWDDPSGRRLRDWIGLAPDEFYDPALVALVPSGFCYPGSGPSGDLPPRPECAPTWHDRVLAALPRVELRLILGKYAIARYAPGHPSVTAAVEACRATMRTAPQIVLPHPSPRNQRWFRAHPWFDEEIVPALRQRVRSAIDGRAPESDR